MCMDIISWEAILILLEDDNLRVEQVIFSPIKNLIRDATYDSNKHLSWQFLIYSTIVDAPVSFLREIWDKNNSLNNGIKKYILESNIKAQFMGRDGNMRENERLWLMSTILGEK